VQRKELRRADNFTTFMCGLSRNSGSLNFLEHKGLATKRGVRYDVTFLHLIISSETFLNNDIAFQSTEFLQNKWTCLTLQVVLCILKACQTVSFFQADFFVF